MPSKIPDDTLNSGQGKYPESHSLATGNAEVWHLSKNAYDHLSEIAKKLGWEINVFEMGPEIVFVVKRDKNEYRIDFYKEEVARPNYHTPVFRSSITIFLEGTEKELGLVYFLHPDKSQLCEWVAVWFEVFVFGK